MNIQEWRTNPWLRRAVFLALNLAAGLVIYGLVVAPIRAFFSDRDTFIAEQGALLARLTSIAAQEANVQAAARQVAEQAKRGELLVGPNESVINADLQTRLKTVAEQSGARLRSVQSLPARTSDKVRYVGCQLDIFGSLQAIHKTIHAVESRTPYLFVVAAALKPAPVVNRAGPPEQPVLEARLDIFGSVHIEAREK